MQRAKDDFEMITVNEYLTNPAKFKVPKILETKARGPTCFDFGYYQQHNADVAAELHANESLWKHFVYLGQFESRPFRWVTWGCAWHGASAFTSTYAMGRYIGVLMQ